MHVAVVTLSVTSPTVSEVLCVLVDNFTLSLQELPVSKPKELATVVDINRARVKRGMAKLSAAIAESKAGFVPTDPETLVSKSPDIASMVDELQQVGRDLEREREAAYKLAQAKLAEQRLKDNAAVKRSYRIKDTKKED